MFVAGTANSMQAGTTMQFTATVKNFTETDAVTWSISGSQSADTTISESGLHHSLGGRKPLSLITVTATSVEDTQASASASVTIRRHMHCGFQWMADELYPGDTANFAVYYKGEALPSENYTWSVEAQNASWYGDITSADTKIENGVLTIGEDETCTSLRVKSGFCKRCRIYAGSIGKRTVFS